MNRSIQTWLQEFGTLLLKSYAPNRQSLSFVSSISYLRWIIPLAMIILGTGYVLFEHVVMLGFPLFSAHVLRTVFVIGIGVPALAWSLLNLTVKIAEREAESQRELAFRNRELTAINAIGDAASHSLKLNEIFQTALEKMVELMHLEAGEIRLVEGESLVLKSHFAVSPEFIAREGVVQLGECLCGECASSGQLIYKSNLDSGIPLTQSACWLEGFRSTISIPMKANEHILGVVHVASRRKNAFSEMDRELLSAISNRVAVAIENAQLYEQAQRRVLQLEATSLIGQRMTAVLDLNSLLAELVHLIRERFAYYHCSILLVDEETSSLVLREASGAGAELIKKRGLRLKIGKEGISGWVAHTGQTLLCNDIRREPRFYKAGLVPNTKSELAVPLRVGSQIIGVLDVQGDNYDDFDKEDVTVLQILGNQASIAIENARLYQETRRRYNAMVALHEVSLDIISELDMPKLIGSLLKRGALLLGASTSSLFLYDSSRGLIRNIANHNTWRDWTGVAVQPGEGVIGQVILTGQPLIVNDYPNWKHRSGAFEGAPQTRAVGVPLRWQNETIGGMVVSDISEARPFDGDDVWLLGQFGDLASIAVKNAEFHAQITEFNQELEGRITERTLEVSKAKEEIAAKAKQLRALLVMTITIQEEERARIAHDMHDGVIQLITGARYELQAAKIVGGSALNSSARTKLDTAYKILDEMKTEIRRAIYDLHPPILDALGLAPAIKKYAARFQDLVGLECRVGITGDPARLSPSAEIAVFRIVEEALQNVATHAKARTLSVTLIFDPQMLSVTIMDDGHGFDYEEWINNQNGEHLGLLGMQERIASLGGTWKIHSHPQKGTCVEFQLPVK